MVCALESVTKEILISSKARRMIKIGSSNSKMKLFKSRRITLNRFKKVALKWMKN